MDHVLADHRVVGRVVPARLEEVQLLQRPPDLDVLELLRLVHVLGPELHEPVADLELHVRRTSACRSGSDLRLLFSNRFECRFSSHFTFVCPLRLMNLGVSVLPTGAATRAAASRPAARQERVRTTAKTSRGVGRGPPTSITRTPAGGKRSCGSYNSGHGPGVGNRPPRPPAVRRGRRPVAVLPRPRPGGDAVRRPAIRPAGRRRLPRPHPQCFLPYYAKGPDFGFWVAEERATRQFVGWFHLRPALDYRFAREAGFVEGEFDTGYRLVRAAWGKGYATEVTRARGPPAGSPTRRSRPSSPRPRRQPRRRVGCWRSAGLEAGGRVSTAGVRDAGRQARRHPPRVCRRVRAIGQPTATATRQPAAAAGGCPCPCGTGPSGPGTPASSGRAAPSAASRGPRRQVAARGRRTPGRPRTSPALRRRARPARSAGPNCCRICSDRLICSSRCRVFSAGVMWAYRSRSLLELPAAARRPSACALGRRQLVHRRPHLAALLLPLVRGPVLGIGRGELGPGVA